MFQKIRLIDSWIEKAAKFLLVIFVMSMLVMSSFNIAARWFQINLSWVDPFVRHLVFLCAFLGGVIATGRGTHIGIDVIGKFFEAKKMHTTRRIIYQLTMIAALSLADAVTSLGAVSAR